MGGHSFSVETKDFEVAAVSAEQVKDFAEMVGVELVKISGDALKKDPIDGASRKVSKSKGGKTLGVSGRPAGSVISKVEGTGVVAVGSHLVYVGIHQEDGRAERGAGTKILLRSYLGHEKGWPERLMRTPEVRRFFT